MTESATTPGKAPKTRRARRIQIALVSALAIGGAVRIALPVAIEWAIPWAALNQAGALVTVGNVDLGVIAGEITLEDLVVGIPPDEVSTLESAPTESVTQSEPLFQLAKIHLAFEWTELLTKRIHINTLSLESPRVRLTQLNNGELALPEPPAPVQSEATSEAASSDEAPSAATESTADSSPTTKPAAAEELPTEPVVADPATPVPADALAADADPEDSPPMESTTGDSEPVAATQDPGWEYLLDIFEVSGADATLTSQATGSELMRLGATRFALDTLAVTPDAVSLGEIEFEEPVIRFQQEWLMNLGSGEGESGPTTSDVPTSTPPVQLKQLKIERLEFTVNTPRGPLHIALRLRVTGAGTAPGHVFPVEVGVEVGNGQIELAGDVGLSPVSFQGRLSWQGLDVPPFLLLAAPDVVPWLSSTRADGDLEVTFHSATGSQPPGLTTRGTSSISNLVFKDPENGELALECERLEIHLEQGFYPLEPGSAIRIHVKTVSVEGPKIAYTNPPDALNRLLVAFGAGEVAPTESDTTPPTEPERVEGEPTTPPVVNVDTLSISGGHIRYADRTVTPTHETNITRVTAEIKAIATTPHPGAQSIAIDGLIGETGTFKLRGSLPNGTGDLKLDVERIDLVSYDSLAREAGWRVDSGATTLRSVIEAHQGSYDTRNELVLHNLGVTPDDGGEFSATFGVSLGLALALLRDPSGDIALSMPVEFGDDGLSVGIGSLIFSALRDAIVGALTSPIKLMGALLSDSDDPVSSTEIGFDAGSSTPNEEAEQRLASLTELLTARPSLRLSLQGQWSAEDRPVVALAILHESALAGTAFPEIEDDSFFSRRRVVAALRERAVGNEALLEPEDEQLLQQYVDAQQVPAERLQELGDSRSARTRAVLLDSGVAPDSVIIEPTESSDRPAVSLTMQPKPESSNDEGEAATSHENERS